MRIVDADEVIQSVDRQISMARELLSNDPQYQEFVSITEQCFKQEISNAPTVKAIPIEQLLSILPEYDDYIHTKTYPHNEIMEYIYSKGHEEGWNACLRAIKEELDYWEKEHEERTNA